MTLIVAYCDGINISTVSDTSLTYNKDTLLENNFRSSPEYGMLKAIIINSHTFIGFAGNSFYAMNIIKAIYQINLNNKNKLATSEIIKFIDYSRSIYQTDLRPDFIVGEVNSESASLHKISDNGIELNLSTCWIGSKEAFIKYQEYFHKQKHENQEISDRYNWSQHMMNTSAMTQAMNSLIDNNDFDEVGGFYVPLHSNKNRKFEYFIHSGVYGMHLPIENSSETWQTFHFNNTAQGGYAYTMLSPTKESIAAVGFFILQLKLTILFCPLISVNYKLYGSQLETQNWIKENLGFELSGLTFG